MTRPTIAVAEAVPADRVTGPVRRARSGDRSWAGKRLALNAVAIVAVVIVWHVASTLQDNMMFPTPAATGEALVEMFTDAADRQQLLMTLGRVVFGFTVGCLAGIFIGSLLGSSVVIATALEPVVHFLRSVTPVAWIVPATIWLGIGEGPLRFIVVYATIFPVILNTLAGMAATSRNKIRMARMFGAHRGRIYGSIVLPSAVPYIATGMRLALGYSFMSVVAAEMVAGNSGIGYLIYQSRVFFDTPTMFAGIVVLGISGIVFDRIFVIVSTALLGRFDNGQVKG